MPNKNGYSTTLPLSPVVLEKKKKKDDRNETTTGTAKIEGRGGSPATIVHLNFQNKKNV